MKKIAGVFLGSGATRRIGFGFVPDFVTIRNVENANLPQLVWDRAMTVHSRSPEGLIYQHDTDKIAQTVRTRGQGVQRYYGGVKIAASAVTDLIPTSEHPEFQGDHRSKGDGGTINRFTLDHAGNATGHFDAPANTTYVNAGSRILINGKLYTVQAIANQGTAANEVTLDRAAEHGRVDYIGYRYDFVSAPVGMTMPAGIVLADQVVNVNNELCFIEAGLYDS